MNEPDTRRLLRIAGWLLTPLVAWAVSFFGGWIGALIGAQAESGGDGVRWLLGGAIIGGALGVVSWSLFMWVVGKKLAEEGVESRAFDNPEEVEGPRLKDSRSSS